MWEARFFSAQTLADPSHTMCAVSYGARGIASYLFLSQLYFRVSRPAPRNVALVFSHADRTNNGCQSSPACAIGYSAVLLLDGSAYDLLELLCDEFANHRKGLSIWRTACFVALFLLAGSRLPPPAELYTQADRSSSV